MNFDGHPTCATNNMAPAEGTLCGDNKVPILVHFIIGGLFGGWRQLSSIPFKDNKISRARSHFHGASSPGSCGLVASP